MTYEFYIENLATEKSKAKGRFVTYKLTDISPDCSFLEMLDILNEQLD